MACMSGSGSVVNAMAGYPSGRKFFSASRRILLKASSVGFSPRVPGSSTISSTPAAVDLCRQVGKGLQSVGADGQRATGLLGDLCRSLGLGRVGNVQQRSLARQGRGRLLQDARPSADISTQGQARFLRRQTGRFREPLGVARLVVHGHQIHSDLHCRPARNSTCRPPRPVRRRHRRQGCRRSARPLPWGGGTSPRAGRAASRCRS